MKRQVFLCVLVLGFLLSSFGCNHNSTTAPSEIVPARVGSFSEAMVSFNFDDGRACAFNTAIPILESAGLKSTDYIITQRLTGANDYITIANVLSLEARGHEIGNHTRTHRDLTTLSQSDWQNEILGAKQDLLNFGVRTVQTLAYPFGAYNRDIESFISGAGYLGARSTDNGDTLSNTDHFALKRRNLGGSVTISDVQDWLNTATANKEWLILVSHHVDNSPSEYSITPDLLKQIVNLVASKHIRVVTISEGLRAM